LSYASKNTICQQFKELIKTLPSSANRA